MMASWDNAGAGAAMGGQPLNHAFIVVMGVHRVRYANGPRASGVVESVHTVLFTLVHCQSWNCSIVQSRLFISVQSRMRCVP
ncbi:hypothetical protein D3C80_1802260 [compost metagenome]